MAKRKTRQIRTPEERSASRIHLRAIRAARFVRVATNLAKVMVDKDGPDAAIKEEVRSAILNIAYTVSGLMGDDGADQVAATQLASTLNRFSAGQGCEYAYENGRIVRYEIIRRRSDTVHDDIHDEDEAA